jgi:hypothetical protein
VRGAFAVAHLREQSDNAHISLLVGDLTTRRGVDAIGDASLGRGRALDVLLASSRCA